MADLRFNPPPGWPRMAQGFVPPVGWEPPDAWGAPPHGWPLWASPPARRRSVLLALFTHVVAVAAVLTLLLGLGAATFTRPEFVDRLIGPRSAQELASELVESGVPLSGIQQQNGDSDPNGLLGRSGQYTQRVSFDLPGAGSSAQPFDVSHGGVIEWWPSEDAAQARKDYITRVAAGIPALSEYDYVHGNALVRLAPTVSEAQAADVATALSGM